jgi:hypothetical protein
MLLRAFFSTVNANMLVTGDTIKSERYVNGTTLVYDYYIFKMVNDSLYGYLSQYSGFFQGTYIGIKQ